MDIYKSRERGREDVSINTGNIEALALSGDSYNRIHLINHKAIKLRREEADPGDCNFFGGSPMYA
jgi:hypothetical protein